MSRAAGQITRHYSRNNVRSISTRSQQSSFRTNVIPSDPSLLQFVSHVSLLFSSLALPRESHAGIVKSVAHIASLFHSFLSSKTFREFDEFGKKREKRRAAWKEIKKMPSLTAHLVKLDETALQKATTHPFLSAAATSSLQPHKLRQWLAQDRLYALSCK